MYMGALVGKPLDMMLARTASFESQSVLLSNGKFDLTSKDDKE